MKRYGEIAGINYDNDLTITLCSQESVVLTDILVREFDGCAYFDASGLDLCLPFNYKNKIIKPIDWKLTIQRYYFLFFISSFQKG